MTPHDSRIAVLPPAVTEKIAAGEVVERPASVVKELVENSLDAGATRVEIAVEDAGFSLIKISDNGHGMGPEDLQKSVLRHATSKIRTAEDLFCVATLGFRGEALASIAAVARLSIASSAADDGLGYEVLSEDGNLSAAKPCRHLRGTTVTVRDLFFNVPARKKFMKSRTAERLALLRTLEQLVIAYPSVHFSVWAEGKKALEAPRADSSLERIAQVAGPEFARELITCKGNNGVMAATMYISAPAHAVARPRCQYLYVNLRRVDSDQVTFGIREGFAQFMTKQLRPAWFCFLEVDPKRIDVNVHPTKQRVKFDDERAVFGFVYHLVRQSIPETIVAARDIAGPAAGRPAAVGSAPASQLQGARGLSLSTAMPLPGTGARVPPDGAMQTTMSFLSLAPKDAAGEKELEFPLDSRVKLREERWELISCYQIHRLFILAPIKNGILLIDQHAAHERVLYEQALEDLKTGRAASQRLLFPIIIELSAAEKSVVMEGRDCFTALGFDVQDFGGPSIAVSAIPASGMRDGAVQEAVREMIGQFMVEKDPEILSRPERRYAAAFACGAAIKAGQEMKQEEMNALLNSLFAAENPYVCPHGRPTLVRISLEELSRRFLR